MHMSWREFGVSVLCLGALVLLVVGAGALLPLLAQLLQEVGIETAEGMRSGGASGYLKFVLEQGPLFTVTVAFISVIWVDLDRNAGMVSADPKKYVAACMWVLAGVYHGMAGIRPKRTESESAAPATEDPESPGSGQLLAQVPLILFWALGFVVDTLLGLFVMFLLAVLGIVWMLCVAPPLYFLTLISGAPARLTLRGSPDRRYVVESGGRVELETASDEAPDQLDWEGRCRTTMEVTLATRPVSLTNASATFVLWVAGAVVALIEAA